MKKTLVTILMVGAIASIPPQARTAEPKCVIQVVRCVSVVVVTAAGCVTVYFVHRWCSRVFSNRNWQLTNEAASLMPPLMTASEGPGKFTIQHAEGLGSAWVDGYTFDLQQVDGRVVGVASLNGVPVATNSAAVTNDGQVVTLDFRGLLPVSTNDCPPVQTFRLIER